MRTIHRVALIFSIVSLAFGITGFIGPLVMNPRRRFLNRIPGIKNIPVVNKAVKPSLINTEPGLQFGIAATNWEHSLAHTLMGVTGLAIYNFRRDLTQMYVWMMTGIFALLGGMGWVRYGSRPGIHSMMGMAVNTTDNIIHTVWAVVGAFFSLMPDFSLSRLPSARELKGRAREVEDYATSKIEKTTGEKMPA